MLSAAAAGGPPAPPTPGQRLSQQPDLPPTGPGPALCAVSYIAPPSPRLARRRPYRQQQRQGTPWQDGRAPQAVCRGAWQAGAVAIPGAPGPSNSEVCLSWGGRPSQCPSPPCTHRPHLSGSERKSSTLVLSHSVASGSWGRGSRACRQASGRTHTRALAAECTRSNEQPTPHAVMHGV